MLEIRLAMKTIDIIQTTNFPSDSLTLIKTIHYKVGDTNKFKDLRFVEHK